MFGLTAGANIWLSTRPADMRKAYDGLAGEVRDFMGGDPLSGGWYVFVNKRRDRMKVLVWDRHGYWLLCKRLEAGRFAMPGEPGGDTSGAWRLSYEQLVLIVEGIDVTTVHQRKRFSFTAKK